ncbi:MAG: isoprenylcysteine carboxylmethyltransferase family protein [Candidatus Thorarchaeota archaeon]
MIEWLNFIFLLVLSLFGSMYLYVKSVGPAALEQKIGEGSYEKCAWYRKLSGYLLAIGMLGYVAYLFYPLPVPLPAIFPMPYFLVVLIAILILLPSVYLMYRGTKDAGEETARPRKEHTLYGGIYNKIRHPQMLGEVWTGLVFALFLNSPFLTIYSFIIFPFFYWAAVSEEKDLVIRYGQPYIDYRNRTGMFFPKRKKGDQNE